MGEKAKLTLLAMLCLAACSGSIAAGKQSAASALISSCQVDWERLNLKKMKDPGSLEWDRSNATFGTYGKQGKEVTAVTVPFRAKNGFGALTLEHAVCEIDVDKNVVVRVLK